MCKSHKNTKMNKSILFYLALLLVFTMLMSLAVVSSFAEEAPAEDDGKVTVYFQNNWLWTDVTCYYWGSATAENPTWPGLPMTKVGTQDNLDVYTFDVPTDVTGLIFNGIKNDGSGKLDQTPDITDGIIDGAGWKMLWNNGNKVEAFEYNPSEPDNGETPVDPDNGETPVDPDNGETPVTPEGDFYLVGYINGADKGFGGDASSNYNEFKFVDGSLTVTFDRDSYVFVKNGNNADWYWCDSYCQTNTTTLHNYKTGANETAEKMFVPAGQITFTLTQGENDTLVLKYTKGSVGGGSTGTVVPAENPIEPENGYYKIYLYNTAWWDVVCSYIWDANDTEREEWPGQDVYEDTYLLYPILIPQEYSFVIFNNGDKEQTSDIALISIDKNKTVYNNGTGEWMSIDDYDPNLEIEPPVIDVPDYSEYETKRVYLGNSLGWDSANFYAWSNDPEIGQYAAWPGTLMDLDDVTGLYYADVPVCFDRIIFNNGSAQTLDLYMPSIDDDKVVCDIAKVVGAAGGGVDGSDCWVRIDDFEMPDPILPPTYDVTVAVKNDAGWENVFIYFWGGDSTIEWPGTAMEAGPDGYYFAVIPAGTPYVLFHNGNVSEDGTPEFKTADLLVPTDDNVLFNNVDNQWHYYVIDGNQPDDPVVDPDNKPGTDDSEGNNKPSSEMNIFQKLWRVILEFFRRLFASFKK